MLATEATGTPAPAPTIRPTSTPAETSAPTPAACTETRGRFEDQAIPSELLGEDLVFRVYLPPCYEYDLQLNYPVLYLLHGQTYTPDQWDRIGADEALERLIARGETQGIIMVFPYDRGWRQPSADLFGEALVKELVPWIDAGYRTLASREYRAVGGLSRGAGWAVHLAFTYPEVFSKVGAHSLALFWEDSDELPYWMRDLSTEEIPELYLDIGRSDRELISAQDFEAALNAHNVPHQWVLNLGYHDEAYWSAHVEQYLRFYINGW